MVLLIPQLLLLNLSLHLEIRAGLATQAKMAKVT